jgi:hypothetical protein
MTSSTGNLGVWYCNPIGDYMTEMHIHLYITNVVRFN